MELREAQSKGSKKCDDPIDVSKFGETCREELLSPSEAHIEKKEALEIAAPFDEKLVDLLEHMEGRVPKHIVPVFFFRIAGICFKNKREAAILLSIMQEFCSLSLEELKIWLEKEGEKPFRALQIYDWIYAKDATSFEQMSNIGHKLRVKLTGKLGFPVLKLLRTLESKDCETLKFLWELPDKKRVESVLIMSGDRRTVCISCQVGCPARCAFCASGKEGLMRNLSAAEIVEQVLHINRILKLKGERVSHLVFMGMGEPLENYDAMIQSIKIFNLPEAFCISQRRITVSTVGVVEGIHKLAGEEIKVNLVLSLHAPNQHIRKKIIPYARRYPLEEILLAMDHYAYKSKRDITYEYTLLSGINDRLEHARELAELLKDKQCTVNLIPYNPVDGLHLKRPEREEVEAFRALLEEKKINTTWRYTKGKDIAAACGQLALNS
jgi:23S rRNA (adenine2503-C2)-methyltransferase